MNQNLHDQPVLPPAVTAYFAALAGEPADALALFTPDAVVTDDGRTYRGQVEILGWLSGPAGEFTVTTTRLSVQVDGPAVLVVNRLDGNFPGGTVTLRHVFGLSPAGLISALTIAP